MVILFTGEPASVHLTCSLHSLYTIQCIWSIPYTIMGISITGYNITTNTSTITVTNTEYYYNVSQFGMYSISVAAVISDHLEGEIDSIMTEVPEGIHSYSNNYIRFIILIKIILTIETIDNWSLGVNYIDGIQTVYCSIMVCALY